LLSAELSFPVVLLFLPVCLFFVELSFPVVLLFVVLFEQLQDELPLIHRAFSDRPQRSQLLFVEVAEQA
jgi:hypothetical protein